MESSAPRIFSPQAILISVAVHAVVVGGLFSIGTPPEEVPAKETPTETPSKESAADEAARDVPPKPEDKPVGKAETPAAGPGTGQTARKTDDGGRREEKPAEMKIEPRRDDAEPERETAQAKTLDAQSPASGGTREYVVKRGDTLTAIAKGCGLTISELAKLNGSSVKKLSGLKIGQRLKLPATEQVRRP